MRPADSMPVHSKLLPPSVVIKGDLSFIANMHLKIAADERSQHAWIRERARARQRVRERGRQKEREEWCEREKQGVKDKVERAKRSVGQREGGREKKKDSGEREEKRQKKERGRQANDSRVIHCPIPFVRYSHTCH